MPCSVNSHFKLTTITHLLPLPFHYDTYRYEITLGSRNKYDVDGHYFIRGANP